jgi:hypothetical protein
VIETSFQRTTGVIRVSFLYNIIYTIGGHIMSNHNKQIKKQLLDNLEYYRERSKKYGDDLSMIYEFWLDSKRIELKLEQTINELDNDK